MPGQTKPESKKSKKSTTKDSTLVPKGRESKKSIQKDKTTVGDTVSKAPSTPASEKAKKQPLRKAMSAADKRKSEEAAGIESSVDHPLAHVLGVSVLELYLHGVTDRKRMIEVLKQPFNQPVSTQKKNLVQYIKDRKFIQRRIAKERKDRDTSTFKTDKHYLTEGLCKNLRTNIQAARDFMLKRPKDVSRIEKSLRHAFKSSGGTLSDFDKDINDLLTKCLDGPDKLYDKEGKPVINALSKGLQSYIDESKERLDHYDLLVDILDPRVKKAETEKTLTTLKKKSCFVDSFDPKKHIFTNGTCNKTRKALEEATKFIEKLSKKDVTKKK
ncbi:hypothetical protein ADUPG1_011070 [Aduncisulcus paluster]|uniref:Uncharacterized protein n=1 Tax=Aduncisulcus paluster TaxID=2918883 RepID=A0ABQ5JU39_9EUKA|nr:hypothetical protein ADUPG1_011070 [Aduncisulcus paluster]